MCSIARTGPLASRPPADAPRPGSISPTVAPGAGRVDHYEPVRGGAIAPAINLG